MKSNSTTSSDGHFPYGDQPDYRDFLMPLELETEFLKHNKANQETRDPIIVAKYFSPV